MIEQRLEKREFRLSKLYLWSTLVIAVLVTTSSLAGIFVKNTYARDTANWAAQARAQDVTDLIAIATLLVSTLFMYRGSVRGYQVWAGAVLSLIYAFVSYSFESDFNTLFLLYVAVLGLLVYTFIGGVLQQDFAKIRSAIRIADLTRYGLGTLLTLLGFAFYFLWLSEDVPAILNGAVPSSVAQAGLMVNPIHVLDMALYLPAMIIAGISLLKNKTLGYAFGLPLFVFSVLTGLGIALILLQ
jgi:hypothetical protein